MKSKQEKNVLHFRRFIFYDICVPNRLFQDCSDILSLLLPKTFNCFCLTFSIDRELKFYLSNNDENPLCVGNRQDFCSSSAKTDISSTRFF